MCKRGHVEDEDNEILHSCSLENRGKGKCGELDIQHDEMEMNEEDHEAVLQICLPLLEEKLTLIP